MKLIIDIPEQIYLNAKADTLFGADILVKAIKNGTPISKGFEEFMITIFKQGQKESEGKE